MYYEGLVSLGYHASFGLAAKYIAIAAYNGSFSLDRIDAILGIDARKHFHDELYFALSHGYMMKDLEDRICVTKDGFKHYGAIFSLFYAPN